MSYSFNVRGASKSATQLALHQAIEELTKNQGAHKLDAVAIENNANGILNLMPEPAEGQDLVLTCSGYVTWDQAVTTEELDAGQIVPNGLNISCYAHFIARDLASDGTGKAIDPKE